MTLSLSSIYQYTQKNAKMIGIALLIFTAIVILTLYLFIPKFRSFSSLSVTASGFAPTKNANVAASSLSMPLSSSTSPNFSPNATPSIGYIISGAPDYMIVTLKKITIKVDGNDQDVWSGNQSLNVSSGQVDVSAITNSSSLTIPNGTATQITLEFDSLCKMKGTLTNSFYTQPNFQGLQADVSVSTKSSLSYDPNTATGGSTNFSDFLSNSTAEEVSVYLSKGSTLTVTTACNTVINGSVVNLGIVFDLNRALRWYSGGNNQGVNPGDSPTNSYFFSHSLMGSNIACFFGQVGSMQGYKTMFAPTNSTTSIPGWMNLIFAPDGTFLSGFLMPDNDNDLTISKGRVLNYTPDVSFEYDIAQGKVLNFSKITNLNNHSDLCDFTSQAAPTGKCYFQLLLVK